MNAMLVALPSGAAVNLHKDKTLIGRNPDNDIVAGEKFVSRTHCALVKKGGSFYLEDLHSSNGTFLNGERIGESVRLRNNDTISLGQQSRAYQFRLYSGLLRNAGEFVQKPLHIVLIAAGVLIVFGLLSYFIVFRYLGKIDVSAGLARLERTHGAAAFPRDSAFLAAVEKRVEQVQADETFRPAVARRKQYRGMIEGVLRSNGLPLDYSIIAWVESSYEPAARNWRSGAAGMWQLLPATARAYGLRVDRKTDERFNAERSTEAAVLYLKDIVSMYGKDSFLLSLAAYNAGDNAILYSLKQIEDPLKDRNFWYLYQHDLIPAETKEYVLRIVALAIVAQNL
jgi:hypothetical protein